MGNSKRQGWAMGCALAAVLFSGAALTRAADDETVTTTRMVTELPPDRKPVGQKMWSQGLVSSAEDWLKKQFNGKRFGGVGNIVPGSGIADSPYGRIVEPPKEDAGTDYQVVMKLQHDLGRHDMRAKSHDADRVTVEGRIDDIKVRQLSDRCVVIEVVLGEEEVTPPGDAPAKIFTTQELTAKIPTTRRPGKDKKWNVELLTLLMQSMFSGQLRANGDVETELNSDGILDAHSKPYKAQGTT